MSTLEQFAAEHGTTDDPAASRTHEYSVLKDAKPKNVVSDLEADGEREKWCAKCHNRVTLGCEDQEYGHARTCDRHVHGGSVQ